MSLHLIPNSGEPEGGGSSLAGPNPGQQSC